MVSLALRSLLNTVYSRGEHFRGKVCDVRWDLLAREELSHLIAENVAVVLKQFVRAASVHENDEERETGGKECTLVILKGKVKSY